jgi:aryl-alcohol dehydrogenase-like predicted oxidoreductase
MTDQLREAALVWRECVCGAWYWGAKQTDEDKAHSRAALDTAPPAVDVASEYGRLLAWRDRLMAERDRLIGQGVDPADLDVPLPPS